jgi:uncharacterized protein with HEPN domain
MNSKDLQILEHIHNYCIKITNSFNRFGDKKEFVIDTEFQDVVAFRLLQIGELVNNFSDEFMAENQKYLPWRSMAKIRHIFLHHYDIIDLEIVWNTAKNEIPTLEAFCRDMIKYNQTLTDEIPDPEPPRFRP